MSYDNAFNFVQRKRFIANPNLGFFLQLQIFEKRLLNNEKNKIEIFSVSSFQIEQPNFIVARLIYHNMILNPEIKDIKPIPIFDQRGVFIFCNKNNVFIIICSKVPLNLKDIYINYAKDYIVKIRENEFLCNGNVVLLNEGDYNFDLEKILNDNQIKIEFGINKNLDQYYINFDNNLNDDDNINDLNINDNNNLENKKLILDQRGFYIICDKLNCFLLQGNKIYENNKEKYLNYAKYYIEKIHQNEYLILNYDKNNFSYEIIEEGNKNLLFEKFLNENNINIEFGILSDYDKYYIDLSKIEENGNNFNNYLNDKEELIKKGFYFYPKNECYKILNLDDLSDDDYLIACFDNDITKKIFIWKGSNCNISNNEEESFKDFVKLNFFQNNKNIEEIIEIPFEESDDFMELL